MRGLLLKLIFYDAHFPWLLFQRLKLLIGEPFFGSGLRVSHFGMRGLAIGGYSLRSDSKGICQIGIVKLRQGFIFDEVFVVLMLLFQL